MPTLAPDNPSVPHLSAGPTISVHGHLVTGSGFLPDHRVAIRITRARGDISDYLTYMADGHGYLHCALTNGTTGTLYIAATDHRPDPEGACGRLWSNTCPSSLVTPDRPTTNRAAKSLRSGIGATLHDTAGSVHSADQALASATKWVSPGTECWGSLIAAIRGGL